MEEGYKPSPDFGEETKEPLVEIPVTDSTELWLMKWPLNQLQPDDFQGKQLKVKLHRDGKLATVEDASGKSYDLVSFPVREQEAIVFTASKSVSKVVGKISRRVSFVHYPEPADFKDLGSFSRPSGSIQRSGGLSRTRSNNMTPVGSAQLRSMSQGIATPTSTKRDSGFMSGTSYESGGLSSRPKKSTDGSSPSRERARSSDRSTRDSGLSSLSMGASGLSNAAKSKHKIKAEEE
ncbi:hypothetical protein H6P81_013364 [Aristolochia fimbriata]|uniref:Mediator-associated protein 2 n=1 Tax=Aristolochia fimbriata TaxID=158543 RepID=A0AAV7EHC4_ARIFI|nr:hypothetical protein H6P81_013364 [Aristolochia fimbriata]